MNPRQPRAPQRWADLIQPRPAGPGAGLYTPTRRLLLASPNDPRRQAPRVIGRTNTGRPGRILLEVPDGRYHLHVIGETGAGKSWWLVQYVLGEIRAGRGVALIDPQGDLVRAVLDRMPLWAADRLVLLDPDEHRAPPAYNPLEVATGAAPADANGMADRATELAREWAAEGVAGTMRALYSSAWGARMDGYMRASCLTLVRQPGATLPDIVELLTNTRFRRDLLARAGTPEGLDGFWRNYEQMTPAARLALTDPLVDRLHAVLSRRFARELLGAPRSTFDLGQILDGGILLARLPKGEIGEGTSRLVSGLLLAGLWGQATRRSQLGADQRMDASIIVDEAQNALTLPIDVDLALAESRGYRVSWVLAHQHLDQLSGPVAHAISSNGRNKIVFTVDPADARALVRHFGSHFTEEDLSARPAYQISARTVAGGSNQPGYTMDSIPLDPPIPGRADQIRARARARVGLPLDARGREGNQRKTAAEPHGHRFQQPTGAVPATPAAWLRTAEHPADDGGEHIGDHGDHGDPGGALDGDRRGRGWAS